MTRKSIVLATLAALALGAAAWGTSVSAQPYGPGMGYGPGYMHGPGMMGGYGPGYMHGPGMRGPGYGYGPGMMGPGYGPGWMHRGGYGPGYGPQGDLHLSVDDVKAQLERWLTWRGNPHLKVGEVKEKDADTITADIVTKDNSLVQRFTVNRKTGFYQRDGS
jgi:hypothetical protein